MNTAIQKLAGFFQNLPGIGPRQARRFVYSLLDKDHQYLKELSTLILNLKKETTRCVKCQRFFDADNNKECPLCRNPNRDQSTLLLVEKDVDLENIEKAGFYNGSYYVLGGLVPALGQKMPKEIRMKQLFEKIKKENETKDIQEIVLAFSATTEGENTARYVEKILEPFVQNKRIKISRLGRGLSTGTELEYSDQETIMNAFKNRK
jgi:recombination protein RecR